MKRIITGILGCLVLWGCEAPTSSKTGTRDTDTTASQSSDSAQFVETDTCANLDLSLERQPTTIMLVVDHSASMDLQLGDNDTRWSVLVKALMGTVTDPLSGLVWSLESQVNFGIVLFTAKRNEPETCPLLDTVAPALSNGGAIATIFSADDETYKGASPVPEGVAAATELLTQMEVPGKKVILLATDGEPQTCDSLAEIDDAAGRTAAVEAVQAAYEQGIATFVVGLGDETSVEHLQQVANAGMGLAPKGGDDASFYQGLTENSLVEAVTKIIVEQSRSCVYQLTGKGIASGEEGAGTVDLDGEPLILDDAEYGWRMKSESEFELLGGACDDIQVGAHHLKADFPCEVIVPVVID